MSRSFITFYKKRDELIFDTVLYSNHPLELILCIAVLDSTHSIIQPFRHGSHVTATISERHHLIIVYYLVYGGHHYIW